MMREDRKPTSPCPPPPSSAQRGGVLRVLTELDLYALGIKRSDVEPGFDVDLAGDD